MAKKHEGLSLRKSIMQIEGVATLELELKSHYHGEDTVELFNEIDKAFNEYFAKLDD